MIHLRRIPIKHKDGKNTASVAFVHKKTDYIVESVYIGNTVTVMLSSEGKQLCRQVLSGVDYTTNQAIHKVINEYLVPKKTEGGNKASFVAWINSLQA